MKGDSPMKASNAICAVVKEMEGLSLRIYSDAVGVMTVGYGHAIKSGEEAGLKEIGIDINNLTFEMANQLFEIDRAHHERLLCEICKNIELSQVQFDALFDFTFNLGIGNFKNSTLLKKLLQNDIDGASKEFGRWIYGNVNGKPKPSAGLVKRREIERVIFLADTTPMNISTTLFTSVVRHEIQQILISYAQNLFSEKRIKTELAR